MIRAAMPSLHHPEFRPHHPFPRLHHEELDNFAQRFGIKVYRPREVDWAKANEGRGGDGLMVMGRTVVEACFGWGCRRGEVEAAFSDILEEVVGEVEKKGEEGVRICRVPRIVGGDTLYDGLLDQDEGSLKEPRPEKNGVKQNMNGTLEEKTQNGKKNTPISIKWAINNTRPAFDCADFMRFGTVLIGQLSNVTNPKGVDYLRAVLPEPYTVELLNTTDDHAMHIDATILPLRHGTLVYCPSRVTEEELRRHEVFRDWDLRPLPWNPEEEEDEDDTDDDGPPRYMCSKWLVLNAMSVNEKTIVVEERQERFARWLEEEFGMEVVRLPFRHVNSLGGSFHCATVDLARGEF
ncbi:hypothetical protein B0H65DRAFT_507414 [Neurospora tetraspora]|uniref:Glycine amidinotransferase, mitochondrial n=1 Tax=Neurospora tetraspora TaxID=94610 RepID=A0AAE0MVU9_9PEZI|nr:hypothetical protein B0H65DRAFT_507414 [Neurospora tetraspora]